MRDSIEKDSFGRHASDLPLLLERFDAYLNAVDRD